MMKRSSAWSKKAVFTAACAGMFFFGIALISLGSILPFLSAKFSLDGPAAATVVTFLPAGVLIGSVVFGPFVDRFGYKFLLIFSSVITITGLAWIASADSLAAVRIAVFLTGFGGGILNGETNTIVSDISGEDRNSNLSFLAIFFGIGALGVPVLMSILSERFPFESILAGTSVFMVIIMIFFFMIKFPEPKQAHGFPVRQGFRLLKQPLLLLLSLALFFQSGMEGLSNNWTTTYLEAGGVPRDKALFSLTCMVIGMTSARLIMGFLLKKVKSYVVLVAGLMIILLGILTLITGIFSHNAGMTLLGVGFAPVFPVLLGYIGTLYPELSGTAFSIALFIALIGNTTLNYIMGNAAGRFGIGVFPFMLLFAVIIMSLVLFLALKKDSLTTKVK